MYATGGAQCVNKYKLELIKVCVSTFSRDHAKPFLTCSFPPMFIFFIMPRQVYPDDSAVEQR